MNEPVDPSSLTIREYRPGDEHAILETFNRVFGEMDPNFTPRTLEQWRWAYLENPSGWRISLAVTPEGAVVSQYAGLGQRMRVDGRPANFSQAVDSMTDPAWRRGLKRPGFFVLTGYPYAAQYGGTRPDQDMIMWGMPIPPAWRIGRSYLNYELVRAPLKLRCAPDAMTIGSHAGIEVREVERFDLELEALFERVVPEIRALAVRDRAQMNWRFAEHPTKRYVLLEARRSGHVVGVAVYAQGSLEVDENQGLVCDWLVPAAETHAEQALLAALQTRGAADGVDRMAAMFPDTCRAWRLFQDAGFHAETTQYTLVGRQYTRAVDVRWLHQHWYYTLGDTDLV